VTHLPYKFCVVMAANPGGSLILRTEGNVVFYDSGLSSCLASCPVGSEIHIMEF
jgi:hypothetical protein